MDTVHNIIKSITDMGATAILPIIITVLGLVFRMKIGNAIKSGLLVGVGFLGLTLVVGLLNSSLKPAVDYYAKIGSGFTIADIGWYSCRGGILGASFCSISNPSWFNY